MSEKIAGVSHSSYGLIAMDAERHHRPCAGGAVTGTQMEAFFTARHHRPCARKFVER